MEFNSGFKGLKLHKISCTYIKWYTAWKQEANCRLQVASTFPLHILRISVTSQVIKVEVKCTLVQAQRLCTGRTAHRGSRGIALLFHNHGTRRGWGVSVMTRPFFTPRKDPVPIVQEAGWDPGPVWTSAENLAPIGIRSPDRPARGQSLYRLRYPVHSQVTRQA